MLDKHHRAWLDAHPHRSASWLKARLADGFDVHHADGDHSNNSPRNLFLIEATDHMRLHGGDLNRLLGERSISAKQASAAQARNCYHLRGQGYSWPEIAAHVGINYHSVIQNTKRYAKEQSLHWPIVDFLETPPYNRRGVGSIPLRQISPSPAPRCSTD